LVAVRRQVAASGEQYSRVDKLWAQSLDFEKRAHQTLLKLVRAERAELAIMRKKLAVEMGHMGSIEADLGGTATQMDGLSSGITLAGISRVEDAFDETVMGADRGIVDVYWVKKGNATAEKLRLNNEKSKRRQELKQRFLIINSRLEQSSGSSGEGG
jgi:hypothetical protein